MLLRVWVGDKDQGRRCVTTGVGRGRGYRYAEVRACGKRGEHAHGLDPMETNSFVLSTPHYSCMDTGCSLGMASQ